MAAEISQPGFPIELTQIVHIQHFWSTGNQIGIAGIHYRCTSVSANPPNAGEVAKAKQDRITPAAILMTSGIVTLLGCKVSSPNPQPLRQPGIALDGTAGSIDAAILPTQVSMLITTQTLAGGRAGQGRAYIPFPLAILSDVEGNVSIAGKQVLAVLAPIFIETININIAGQTATLVPVLFHRKTGGYTNIKGYRANPKFATQRRRGNYGRPNATVIT